jgi:hypothetical protein
MVTSSVELTLGEALDETTTNFRLTGIPCTATTNAINLYLDSEHIKNVVAAAKETNKKDELNAYVFEALRKFYSTHSHGSVIDLIFFRAACSFPGCNPCVFNQSML